MCPQGVKCAHHENGREGADAGADTGEDSTEREKLANKFRHHPIYRLSLGQVNTNIRNALRKGGIMWGKFPNGPHIFCPVNWTVQRKQWSNNAFFLRASTLTPQFGLGVTAVLAQLAITFFNDVHLDLYTLNEGLLCGASFAVTVSFIHFTKKIWSHHHHQGLLGISAARWLSPRMGTLFLLASALAAILAVSQLFSPFAHLNNV